MLKRRISVEQIHFKRIFIALLFTPCLLTQLTQLTQTPAERSGRVVEN